MRKLAIKAATSAVKEAFIAKGVKVTHTEALNLIAKLQGFEAWSHLSQVTEKPAKLRKVEPPLRTSLGEILANHFGADGECPLYPRSDWIYQVENGDTRLGYWDFVHSIAEAIYPPGEGNDQADCVQDDYLSPIPVSVTLPSGVPAIWDIQANLTTRHGEFNDFDADHKPAAAILAVSPEVLKELRAKMHTELSFIVYKDHGFGLLLEVEYASQESEVGSDPDETLQPHAKVVETLLKGLRELAPEYPGVEFCVPSEFEIVNDRPAVWAYIPKNLQVTPQELDGLASTLMSF